MAVLAREDVLNLAKLARLELSEAEIEELSQELTDILRYVEKLQGVGVDELKPTNQVTGLTNVLRPDEKLHYGYEARDLLKNVPTVKDDQIKVKRILA